jgi:hypothetical protein
VIHGLVLKIDTDELNRGGTQEDQIAEHYEWALSTLVPPEHHVCVTTYLTTEPERTFDERFRLILTGHEMMEAGRTLGKIVLVP